MDFGIGRQVPAAMVSQSSYILTQSGVINFRERGSRSAVTRQVPVSHLQSRRIAAFDHYPPNNTTVMQAAVKGSIYVCEVSKNVSVLDLYVSVSV